MLEFRDPEIEDLAWIRNALDYSKQITCDYALGYIIGWCSQHNFIISDIDGCFISKLKDEDCFTFPQGKNWKKALEKLCVEYNMPTFVFLTDKDKQKLSSVFENDYVYYKSGDSYDYLYSREDLAELPGKKYHQKRNHISYFIKNYNWSYEALTSESMNECLAMNEEWYKLNQVKNPFEIKAEKDLLDFALKHYDRFDFKGGILRVDGKIIAFTFGEELNEEVFDTHFEKAFSSYRGSYAMINKLFAGETISKYKYINREDDAGDEGLRKAKLSYHPIMLLDKYTAVRI